MNSIRLLASLPVLTLGIAAQAVASPQLPDRPAVALSRYKDTWAPVVGVDAGSPVVVANGRQVVLTPDAAILLSVGGHYADGFVTVTDVYSTDVPAIRDPEMAASMSTKLKATSAVFEANLTSDTDVPKAFALFVASPSDQNPDAQSALAVVVRQIGDLQAGKQTHLTATLPKLGQDGGAEWTALVFSPVGQVRSTEMSGVLPAYFDRIETSSLKKRIAERVARGADAPIAVFRQMPLGLPGPIKAKYHGSTVKVDISVNAEGHVVSAKPVGLSDSELSEAVGKGFGLWLFLPPVKGGVAAQGSAIIPLKM